MASDLSVSYSSATDEPWHQLIIIGNGFDRECGLPSRFSDFLGPTHNSLFPHPSTIEDAGVKNWGLFLRQFDLTAWDVILEGKPGDRWCDIEGAIKDWLVPNKKPGHIARSSIGRVGACLAPGNFNRGTFVGDFSIPSNWRRYTGTKNPVMPEIDVARFIFDVCDGKRLDNWNRRDIGAFMLSELHGLEDRFANYLAAKLNESPDYQQKSRELMTSLMTDEHPLDGDRRISGTVLSFNYTSPAADLIKGNGRVRLVNVHGSLDADIVFGIDSMDCADDDIAMPFTKTYRLMDLDAVGLGDIVRPYSYDENPTNVIKFYGHSLGEADYSYFQSLFDAVELYKGPTRLVFYYRPHDDAVDAEARAHENTMRAVTKLLTTYGATLENKDHGKNLVHKLLLEGRLSVRLLQ